MNLDGQWICGQKGTIIMSEASYDELLVEGGSLRYIISGD